MRTDVAEVDGERGEPIADYDSLLRPGGEPAHGEAVAQLVQADPRGAGWPAQAEPAGQLHERPGEDMVVESGAAFGDEEGATQAVVAESPTLLGVGPQRGGGRGMERHEARLPKLGALNLEARRSTDEIDVIDVEANRLAGAEATARQQPDHGGDGVRTQRIGWSEGAGGVHRSNDLVGREDARGGTFARANQPGAGHVDVGLGGADHREKPAHDAQPPRVLAFGARRGPLDGDLRNRGVVAAPFEMLDEVVQEADFPLHGEADGAAQRDVGLHVLAPSLAGHRVPPGHGRAIVARVSRSSLA